MTRIFVAAAALAGTALAADQVLVESESFKDPGGWSLDTQFVESMGSPYLLAHGMGEPVKDATTTVKFPNPGTYRVWVRTMDRVACWNAPGTPGKFQVFVDGKPPAETFGTKGGTWSWHDGGTGEITKTEIPVGLHDLTGFAGLCDAIFFTRDAAFTPPNSRVALIQNRASKAPVIFASADGQKAVAVDETILALLDKGFVSVGKFRFEAGKRAVVIVGDGPADGTVAIDVIQLVPAE